MSDKKKKKSNFDKNKDPWEFSMQYSWQCEMDQVSRKTQYCYSWYQFHSRYGWKIVPCASRDDFFVCIKHHEHLQHLGRPERADSQRN